MQVRFEDSELKSFSELHPVNFLWHKAECDQTGTDRKLVTRINGGRSAREVNGGNWSVGRLEESKL